MTDKTWPDIDPSAIACQQILEEDHSVFSLQWVVVPPGTPGSMDSTRLLDLYLHHIRSFTLTVVRPAMGKDFLDFRLGNSAPTLIRFTPPEHRDTPRGSRTTLRICSGILVQPGQYGRGQLDFGVERFPEGTRISLQLSDFCPLILGSPRPSRWRRWLYRLTQAYLHKVVTVRFLARVYGDLTGRKPARVVKVVLRAGQET